MKNVRRVHACDVTRLGVVQLEDFSRFKEKVIMINTLKSLIKQTDKRLLQDIAKEEGNEMTSTHLKHALESVVEHAIKRMQS